jgi:exosortase
LGMHLALALSLQGVALCALGIRVYRKLLPLMLFLFLLVPCGDLMQPLLKDLTVKWIEWYAIAFGLPHVIEGYYAMVGEHEYMVVNACSGLPFFTLGAFLGYSFGLLLFHSLKPVVALAALGAALGIATNAMRIWLIVAVDQIRGTQMDIAGHTDIQWLVWFASLALLLYLTVRFTPRGQAVPAELN